MTRFRLIFALLAALLVSPGFAQDISNPQTDASKLATGSLAPARLSLSQATNALGADVNLNNTSNFFDGPSVAQGSTGTWFASGSVTIKDTGVGGGLFFYKLWDGTSVIASGSVTTANASQLVTVSLSGYLASPAGNIRMSVKDLTATTGVIAASSAGPNSSIVSVYRLN